MATLAMRPVVQAPDADVLHAIDDPGCALAIWQRSVPEALARVIDPLDGARVDDIDAVIGVEDAVLDAAVLLGAAGYDGAAARALAVEIGAMAGRFAQVARSTRLRVRLEIVVTDACRRFHADAVTVRLLATYRGAGTQWIEAAVPDAIGQVPTGAVAIFKGRLRADPPMILHRSPPIEGSGNDRLLLVIDPA